MSQFFRRSPYGERGLKLRDDGRVVFDIESLPLWGAWIETTSAIVMASIKASLPLWGAWIETTDPHHSVALRQCRSPYGERGLKHARAGSRRSATSRSPYGERGLKPEITIRPTPKRCRSPMGSVD